MYSLPCAILLNRTARRVATAGKHALQSNAMDPLSPLPFITPPPAFLNSVNTPLYGEVVPQKYPVHQAAPTTYLESKHQLDLSNLHEATNWLRR